jgi:hypothetical protein
MRKTLRAASIALLAVAGLLVPTAGAPADNNPQVTVQIEGGYGGVVPRGGWAPVQVNVTNHGPDAKVTLSLSISGGQNGFSGGGFFKGAPGPNPGPNQGPIPIPAFAPSPGFLGGPLVVPPPGFFAGGGSVTRRLDVVLPAGTTKHFTSYLPASPGTWKADVVAASGKSLAAAETQVSQANSSLTIAVVSDDANALNQIGSIGSLSQTFQGQPQLIHLSPANLPETAAALTSFGLVAVTNATTDSLTAAQRRALDDYVAQGGSVLVTGGNTWRKTQAGLPADLVTLAASGVQTVAGVPGLASALGSPAVAGGVDVATGTRRSGVTALTEGPLPILVEAPVGRGRVLYLAVDPMAGSLVAWPGTLPLLRQVLVRAAADSTAGQSFGPFSIPGKGVQSQGFSLFQALSNIPSLDLPSPLLIALALIVFIVLVGPVNYFLLRRLRRPDMAWGTIPLMVVLSAGSIYGIGLKTRGTDVLADRVRLLYVQPGSSRAYVNAGTGVFAPHAGTHTVSTVSGSMVTTLSGGTSFALGGGIAVPLPFPPSSGATGSLILNEGDPPTVKMTWPNADSIQAFGEEYGQTQSGALDTHVTVAGGRLTGTVVNHTATTITDAVVLSGTAFSSFGAIPPGASVSVDIPMPSASPATIGGSPSLLQQIYLHVPSSCGINGPCNMQGLGSSSGRPSASEREAQRRADVLGGVLGQDAFFVPRPMFVGWTSAPSTPVRVDGHRAQLNELNAYLLQLEPQTTAATAGVDGRPVDAIGSAPSRNLKAPGGGFFLQPNNAATFEFALGATGWQKLSLNESATMNGPTGFGSPATAVYNFRTSAWDPISVSTSQAADIPAPNDHASPDGLLRVRVQSGIGPAEVGVLDVTGERAPSA